MAHGRVVRTGSLVKGKLVVAPLGKLGGGEHGVINRRHSLTQQREDALPVRVFGVEAEVRLAHVVIVQGGNEHIARGIDQIGKIALHAGHPVAVGEGVDAIADVEGREMLAPVFVHALDVYAAPVAQVEFVLAGFVVVKADVHRVRGDRAQIELRAFQICLMPARPAARQEQMHH